jgi:hypothetical protein
MEIVDKVIISHTNHRWFEFSQKEAAVLREALISGVNWEEFANGEFYDFFLGFYESLNDVEYPS